MVSAVCKAKDPRTCPYHGAVIRMNEAQAANDLDAYFVARTQVEAMLKQDWDQVEEVTSALSNSLAAAVQANRDDDRAYKLRPDLYPALPQRSVPDVVVESEVSYDGVYSNKHPKALADIRPADTIDVKDEDGHTTRFYRQGTVFGGDFYALRIQANRPLTPDEAQKLAGITGYQYRASIAGEPLGDPYQDTPYSIVVGADSTKSRRDDLGDGIFDLQENLNNLVKDGTPVRKTNRAGFGTQGTRLIDGFGEDLEIEIYYDNQG